MIRANADVISYELTRAWDRLKLPAEVFDEAIDIDDFRAIVGEDSQIPYTPGITAAEAERRRDLFEFEKREAEYEGHPISQFTTGMLAATFDPVNLALMPVGGANFRAAKAATRWVPFLKQTAIGGGKAGAASIVPEYLIQQEETGQVEPGRLIGTAVGPVIAAPALGGISRALFRGYNGIKNRVNGKQVDAGAHAASGDPTAHPLDRAAAIERAEQDGLNVPYVGERTAPIAVPRQNLRDSFADYEGGWVQFVRDLGARRDTALTRMRQMGMGPDEEVSLRLLRALGDDSDLRTVTPVDYNLALVDLVNQFRAGEILDADQIRYLVDAGLVKMRGRMERTKPRVRLSPTKPRLRAGEPGKPRFRVIGQDTGKPRVRITGTAEGRPTVRFDLEGGKPRVSPGTMKPRVRITDSPGKPRLRPSPNKPRFRFVTDQGKPRLRLIDAAGETVRFVGDEDGAELSVLGREIVRALVNPTGRRKRLLREVQERGIGALRQRLRDDPDLQNEIDQLPRIISERSVDAGTVAAYMDAAQFRREVPATKDLPAEPVQPPARPDPENPAPRDPYGAEAEAQAREAGVTVDDIKQATDSLFNGMETCGV